MKKIVNKLKDIYVYLYLIINKRILFTDKYGLSYYLYKNTRPIDAFRTLNNMYESTKLNTQTATTPIN